MIDIKQCVLELFGLFIIILAALTLIGYITGLKCLTSYGGDVGMSIPTAMGFLGIGWSYFVIAKLFRKLK